MGLPDQVKKGDRVVLSQEARDLWMGVKYVKSWKVGTIIGCKCYGYTRDSVRVVWDGLKEPHAINKRFLDLVPVVGEQQGGAEND